MAGNVNYGVFGGRTLIQSNGVIGGGKSVFVKLQGNKNELVYPTFGGIIKNPFKGEAKMFAGDLCEYRTDANGVSPEVYLLKTYEVNATVGEAANKFQIKNDGYRHIPFVGDKLGIAPASIGGKIANTLTVTEVVAKDGYWEVTVDKSTTVTKGDVLVESDGTNMLVKNVNAVLPCDADFAFAQSADEWENPRYAYTPVLGGLMYINKMSPMPKCVLAKNQSSVNGWFKLQF